MHTYIHTYIHACMHAYIHTYIVLTILCRLDISVDQNSQSPQRVKVDQCSPLFFLVSFPPFSSCWKGSPWRAIRLWSGRHRCLQIAEVNGCHATRRLDHSCARRRFIARLVATCGPTWGVLGGKGATVVCQDMSSRQNYWMNRVVRSCVELWCSSWHLHNW